MRFVDPKNDVAFKKIFGDENHKEVLISFLNAVLDLQGEQEIVEIQFLSPYQAPRLEYLKYTLLDLRAKDKRGVTFIIEMQVEAIEGYKKRFQYYAAKAYSGQIKRGEEYPKLNQVIFIGILDFSAFESKKYLTRHCILNLETNEQDLSDLEFYFIELPKFKKREEELTTMLDKWVYFIKNASELSVAPEGTDAVGLKVAYDIAELFRWSEEELEVYDYWSMKLQDERGAITIAERRALERGEEIGITRGEQIGLQRGELIGLQRGEEIGLQRGEQIGRQAEKVTLAVAMLADGLSDEMIMKYTGLRQEEVAELRSSAEKSTR